MSADYTQHQSTDEIRRAQQLSLQRNAPPAEVPGYQIQRFLGSGAYGEVWVGTDQNTGRKVAIKFYTHRGGVDWSLLSREVEKLVFLSADRYVVQLLDVGWDADPPYYVMDYIENGSLEDLLREEGPRPLPEAIELFHEVSVGLMHLHGKGVLHCDLKPANVLLDQDHKPRLADFGQSRLSHEQSPALGTLFYMAPEQADLEAAPDARWDVYALGALLYCMLTGEPPYRNEDTLSEIDTAAGLEERLTRYRVAINSSKPPQGHRKVPGIDRALIDIVDRCLAASPKDRFASVQSVLEAMRAREEARARRPLLVLGLIGPMLLLIVMAVFGWVAYSRVMKTAVEAVTERTQQSNEFAAKFASRGVAAEINQYFDAVEKVAQDERFQRALKAALEDAQLTERRMNLIDPNEVPQDVKSAAYQEWQQEEQQPFLALQSETLLQQFVSQLIPDQGEVDSGAIDRMVGLLSETAKLQAASWFVCDPYGTQIAAKYRDPGAETRGKNYRWRTYFSGLEEDARESRDGKTYYGNPMGTTADDRPQAIDRTHLSAVFKSTGTGTWKVAISTPVYDLQKNESGRVVKQEFLGVVALTVEVGNFIRNEQFGGTKEQFAVLVDGREGNTRGVILQHPLFDRLLDQHRKLDKFSAEEKFRVDLEDVDAGASQRLDIYYDPIGRCDEGVDYAKPWVAAKSLVLLPNRQLNTGLVVLVQESHGEAVDPINQLGRVLAVSGFGALLLMSSGVLVMWYIYARRLRRPAPASARAITGQQSISSTPLHNMETLTASHARSRPDTE
ncbi:MAG: protein kinase [Pirellulaceae bacterium]